MKNDFSSFHLRHNANITLSSIKIWEFKGGINDSNRKYYLDRSAQPSVNSRYGWRLYCMELYVILKYRDRDNLMIKLIRNGDPFIRFLANLKKLNNYVVNDINIYF